MLWPEVSTVGSHRLGEVLIAGGRAGFDAALREELVRAQSRECAQAQAEYGLILSAHLDVGERVTRQQRAGYAVGFGEGFSGVVRSLSSEASGWRDQDRRAVDQALRAELRADLVAHEEVIAARRKRLGVIGAIVLVVVLVVGGMTWKAEVERRAINDEAKFSRSTPPCSAPRHWRISRYTLPCSTACTSLARRLF